jgi:AAA+ ATPase superfamily predicted ATPase
MLAFFALVLILFYAAILLIFVQEIEERVIYGSFRIVYRPIFYFLFLALFLLFGFVIGSESIPSWTFVSL